MGHRIERPLFISLLNSSQNASRFATHRQIHSADGSVVPYASLGSKLQKLEMLYSKAIWLWETINKRDF